jgi:hypothetical protein
VWRPLLLLSLLAGCLPLLWDGGDCETVVPFTAATYLSKGGRWDRGPGKFAHAEGGAKSLVIEHLVDDTGRVRITYQRAGKTIVETWAGRGIGSIKWADKPPPPPAVHLDRTSWDFGPVPVGKQAPPAIFTLRNLSSLPATATVTLEGGESFALADNTCSTLNGGQSCMVSVVFSPKSGGLLTGKITFNAAPAPPQTAKLVGLGLAPEGGASDPPDAGPDAESPDAPP